MGRSLPETLLLDGKAMLGVWEFSFGELVLAAAALQVLLLVLLGAQYEARSELAALRAFIAQAAGARCPHCGRSVGMGTLEPRSPLPGTPPARGRREPAPVP